MRAKQIPALSVGAALGLGLMLTACGPIAFTDTVNFAAPKVEAPAPEPEKPSRAKRTDTHIELDGKIQFGYDSAEILPESHALLDDVVTILAESPDIAKLDVIGHTSTEGSDSHNKKLSTERAAAVMQYLVDHGVDASRLSSQGKGESSPLVEEKTDADKEKNRRVEFKIETAAAGESSGARGRPGGR
ncbi:MAG: OmpA family protein [Myxococcales bacterium]|nr:OmpA family protein [Myxococcales bacterium]